MEDIKFKSLAQLYKRLLPALRSKKKEIILSGYKTINEIDIWNYLKDNKWNKTTQLTLAIMVDDILNTQNELIVAYKNN